MLEEEDPSCWNLLALVDYFLGQSFHNEYEWSEARAPLEESLLYWNKILEKNPADQNAACRRWKTLIFLASDLEKLELLEESMRLKEETIALGDALRPVMNDRDFDQLSRCRISLAQLVERMGDRPRAEKLLRENIRVLSDTAARPRRRRSLSI